MTTLLKYDIHTAKEFEATIRSGYRVIICAHHDDCVVPTIIGYCIKSMTMDNTEICTLILYSDNEDRPAYSDNGVFERLALNGEIYGDMRMRLYDIENLGIVYTSLIQNTNGYKKISMFSPAFYNLDYDSD